MGCVHLRAYRRARNVSQFAVVLWGTMATPARRPPQLVNRPMKRSVAHNFDPTMAFECSPKSRIAGRIASAVFITTILIAIKRQLHYC